MFDMQSGSKPAGRMNTITIRIKKGGRENKCEMIRILAKDTERQLGMLAVKMWEIIQRKHTEVSW